MFSVISAATLTFISFFSVPPPAPPQDISPSDEFQVQCPAPAADANEGDLTYEPCGE